MTRTVARYIVTSDRLAQPRGTVVDGSEFDGLVQVARLLAGGHIERERPPAPGRREPEHSAGARNPISGINGRPSAPDEGSPEPAEEA